MSIHPSCQAALPVHNKLQLNEPAVTAIALPTSLNTVDHRPTRLRRKTAPARLAALTFVMLAAALVAAVALVCINPESIGPGGSGTMRPRRPAEHGSGWWSLQRAREMIAR